MTSQPLKPQTTIREYVILRVLGKGSYGITYLATDTKNDRPVAIKEFFPMRFAQRDADGIVTAAQPSSDDVEDFDSGLSKFLEEASTLAGFRDENIVEVFDWFQYNGTAYVVMRYEEGGTLSRYLAAHKELIKEKDILDIFIPLLKGLRTVHAKWFLHRDIKPENIYIRRNGQPLLIDFGTARHAASFKAGGMTAYLTPGFAPPEQYDRRGDHGPWTDIYALGATMYYCVTRITPYDGGDRYVSLLRSQTDPLTPATQAAPSMYSKELLEVIDWMMDPDHTKRPQSVDEVLFRLSKLPAHGGAITGRAAPVEPERTQQPPAGKDAASEGSVEELPPTVVSPPGEGDMDKTVLTDPSLQPEPAPTPASKATPKTRAKPKAKPRSKAKSKAKPKPVPPTVRVESEPAAPTNRARDDRRATSETARKDPSLAPSTASPATTGSAGPVTGATAPGEKKPLLMYGAAAAAIIALVGAGLLMWRADEPVSPQQVEEQPAEKPKIEEPEIEEPGIEEPEAEQLAESDAEREQREQQERAEARRRTPGETVKDTLKDGGSAPVMMVIPAGSFAMGCDGAARCTDDQQPSRNVQIGRPFLVSQFEVTFDDYERFATATDRPLPDDQGWGRGQRPVINVTWNDAEAYAGWLRDQTGRPYRLLSEAEWEYIARAGSDEAYFYGNDEAELCSYGNHADADSGLSWSNGRCEDGFGDQTAPAGTYSANDWGVSDLIGNVWEWVADCWHDNYRQAPGNAAAWLTGDGGDCDRRVIRGGSWYDGPEMLLPAIRNWAVTNERHEFLGFRVAADVD